MPTRLLITGAAGMLGQDVERAARARELEVVALGRRDLDITDPAALDRAFRDARPHVVVNCAAWTDVDGAEADPAAARAVNAAGAGNVARAAREGGAWTIHVSSDYVFDGTKREPYLESDGPAPVSAYGRSKLEGERAVAQAAPGAHTIVRSSWLFGHGGPCFPATILRLASERDELRVVDDQVGCPTFTGHLARVLVELATHAAPPLGPAVPARQNPPPGSEDPAPAAPPPGSEDPAPAAPAPGLLHVAGGGECSWFEFAREILALAGSGAAVSPCTTAEMPRPAARPAYSVLRSERSDAPCLPDWREGLREYLAARVAAS